MLSVNVSVGEYFDRLSILDIKLEKIKNEIKLGYIKSERDYLFSSVGEYKHILNTSDYYELCGINKQLWDIEDNIREKESKLEFDENFIDLARSVYKLNDKRFECKNNINQISRSIYREQKSYFKKEE